MKTCSIDGCGSRHYARGWCRVHYNRWERNGDPLVNLRSRGRVCSVDDCTERHLARGFCSRHYQRWEATGTPERVPTTITERFWSKIEHTERGCWEWTGARNDHGYPVFSINGVLVYAHQFAYESYVEAVPADLELDHTCVNPPCVNPAHLEPATHAENVRRAFARKERVA